MTTTQTPPTQTPDPPEMCPKGCGPLNHIEGTDVTNCNTCGFIAGQGVPTDPQPSEPVKPDDIHGPGEAKPNEPRADAPAQPPIDQNKVLEQAVESALSSPGVPGRDEFLTLAQTARMLSMSPLVPKFLRGNPAACFHLAMIGRDLGISPTSATELIDIMPDDKNDFTKGGRAMLSPELTNAQVVRHGMGSIVPLCRTAERCVAVALAPGGELDPNCRAIGRHFYGTPKDYLDIGFTGELPPAGTIPACRCRGIIGETEFTWEDARIAGLVGPLCQVGAHVEETKTRRGGGTYRACGCNQGYKTYPKRMLWWRGSGFCQSDFMPQASLGLYSPEELGAVVDENGRMIDVAQVALPDGFEPEAPPPPPPVEQATDQERADIMTRISNLPSAQQTVLKQRWTEKQREERIQPVAHLTATGLKMAVALVNGAEADAKKDGWSPPVSPPADPAPGPGTADPDSGVVPPGQPEATAPASGAASTQEGTEPAAAPPDAPEGLDEPTAPQPPEGMAPDLAAQWGQPLPVLTEAHSLAAIAMVKVMSGRALNDALRSRDLSTDGTPDDRGARLARVIVQETAQQDWEQANPERDTTIVAPKQVD